MLGKGAYGRPQSSSSKYIYTVGWQNPCQAVEEAATIGNHPSPAKRQVSPLAVPIAIRHGPQRRGSIREGTKLVRRMGCALRAQFADGTTGTPLLHQGRYSVCRDTDHRARFSWKSLRDLPLAPFAIYYSFRAVKAPLLIGKFRNPPHGLRLYRRIVLPVVLIPV